MRDFYIPLIKIILWNQILARLSVSYFIYDGEIKLNQVLHLKDREALHLVKSRRIRVGEEIELQDHRQQRYLVRIESLSNKELVATAFKKIKTPAESPLKINLFQALIKEKQMDFILQKATELGVATVNILHSAYSQRLKKDREKQLSRWHKICLEACKQSGRVVPPSLCFYNALSDPELVRILNSADHPVIQFEQKGSPGLIEYDPGNTGEISIMIGPEGGWKTDELSHIASISMSLGPRTLRAETAAIAAISILQFRFGDMTGN